MVQIMNTQLLKEETLVLTQTEPDTDMVFNACRQNGLNADIIFRPQKKLFRLFRRLWSDHFLPGYSWWYGDWKSKLHHYNTVIIHADKRTRTVPHYIHKIKPTMRIIYWYWNPVNKSTLPELTKDFNIECWSFDENDCKKYHMNKNIQYYYESSVMEDAIKYDIYFIGHDKGRKRVIEEIGKELKNRKIVYKFDVIEKKGKEIPYNEIQNRIRASYAILEITQPGQIGCTLRALEALFFRKKLITTNLNIVNEDFYNKNNIFIYGKDNIELLYDFIRNPYDRSSDIFRDLHTIDAWFLNFFK